MKKLAALAVFFSLIAGHAYAAESIADIAQNKELKTQMIVTFQQTIARHQTMTKEEIVADIQNQLNGKIAEFAKKGLSMDLNSIVNQFQNLDKETILAVETQQLQALMTSTNALFFFTRDFYTALANGEVSFCGISGNYPYYYGYGPCVQIRSEAGKAVTGIIVAPAVILFDLVALPIEFIVSVITGF